MIVEDGRRYRLEIALDDSLHEQKSVALNRYENLETLTNEGLRLRQRNLWILYWNISEEPFMDSVPIFLRKMQSEMMTIPMNGWLPG